MSLRHDPIEALRFLSFHDVQYMMVNGDDYYA